jgi:hypothetical protein
LEYTKAKRVSLSIWRGIPLPSISMFLWQEYQLGTPEIWLPARFASVMDTRVFDGEVLATVRTDTRVINHIAELNMWHLKERQYVA